MPTSTPWPRSTWARTATRTDGPTRLASRTRFGRSGSAAWPRPGLPAGPAGRLGAPDSGVPAPAEGLIPLGGQLSLDRCAAVPYGNGQTTIPPYREEVRMAHL